MTLTTYTDTTDEADETIAVAVGTSPFAVGSFGAAAPTILDDDAPGS